MKLYEITDAYLNIADMEETEEVNKSLDIIQDEFDKKAENIIKVIKNIEADAKALKDEADRLSDKRKRLEKKKEDLKEYLFYNMRATNTKKIKAGIFDINIQKNPPSIKILDENTIPDKYKIFTFKPDKKQLKEDLKNGVKITGVSLEQSESLRIRWVKKRN